MLNLNDPHDLKPADVYRQARLVASKTSRGRDRHWYRSAFELPCQWHLWFDGGRDVISATFSRHDSKWRQGPELSLSSLTTGDGVEILLSRLSTAEFFSQRPKALGVVLHMADEFSLAELDLHPAEGAEDPESLQMLHYRLMDEPRGVLIDREVNEESTSWRLLPFWGAPAGKPYCSAVALPKSREGFLTELVSQGEKNHFPVRVAVTAAAVESLAALPLIDPELEGGQLVAFIYAKFTAVFAIAPGGELRRARSISHRNGSQTPHGLGEILWGMAVSEELAGFGDNPGGGSLKVLLVSASAATLESATREIETRTNSAQLLSVRTMLLTDTPALAGIPGQRPEFLVHGHANAEKAASGQGKLSRTETFQGLLKQWGAHCNYFDTVKLDSPYPTVADLRMLRFSSALVSLIAISLIGVVGYGLYSYFTAIRHPSWNLTPQQITKTEDSLAALQTEKRQMEATELLLQPRSKGWVVLEFLMRAFPEGSDVRMDSFMYSMEAARTNPTIRGGDIQQVGFTRTWSVKGLAKEKGLELLGNLNSQRSLGTLFEKVAEASQDASYRPSPTRQLKIALTQGRNPKYNDRQNSADMLQDPMTEFPFNFDAVITQTVGDEDELALPITKPF